MNDEDRRRLELEVGIASEDNAFESGLLNQGTPSTFTCPECHGVLVSLREGNTIRFRCHTGHAYSALALRSEVRESVEANLWNAVRALEEDVMLLEHLGKHFEEADQPELGRAYREEAREAKERARQVRQNAMRGDQVGRDPLLELTRAQRRRPNLTSGAGGADKSRGTRPFRAPRSRSFGSARRRHCSGFAASPVNASPSCATASTIGVMSSSCMRCTAVPPSALTTGHASTFILRTPTPGTSRLMT